MKTIDGIEYQTGMTLYVIGENHFGCIDLDTYWETYEFRGNVYFQTAPGHEHSFGPASCYYADKQAAIREIVSRLVAERKAKIDSLESQITNWSAQLAF